MDAGDSSLPESINPNNFPAKLWRLVNNPANKAIFWDQQGQFIVIDQNLFERQILSPSSIAPDSADAFKTTNFSSFVRQLNLYGFRKADPADKHVGDDVSYHCFYNTNFQRNHPELVASLRRLTADNKAKIQAGLDVKSRAPNRHLRYSGGGDGRETNVKRGSSSLQSPAHQEPTHPYYPNKAQVMTAHNGTPVPPHFLMRGLGAALSPSIFATNKGMPVSLSHPYTAAASSSSAVHIQQGLLTHMKHGNPNFTTFNAPNAQYQPAYYPPVYQCCHPSLVAPPVTGGGLQTGPFSPPSYYQPSQASFPVNMLRHVDRERQDERKCDINLDTIFQIADEVMPTPPTKSLLKVVTPEKPGAASAPSSCTGNTSLCDSPAKVNPSCPGPIIMAVAGRADLVTFKQEEESVVSVPEQMPEDAMFEVTSDDDEGQ